ncbi:MAG: hypothetical protein NWF05_07155 [Candidatus Bathyarchaeota archaeon]|nr:hypothetical protein [Candidatus Bathyarchaeota archaeon]
MPQKTRQSTKSECLDDPEHLQAMDESNTEWVEQWKRVVKPKPTGTRKKKPST